MVEALIKTDKETLEKIKEIASVRNVSVSGLIREIATGEYSIPKSPIELELQGINAEIDRLQVIIREEHIEQKALRFALNDMLPGLLDKFYEYCHKAHPDRLTEAEKKADAKWWKENGEAFKKWLEIPDEERTFENDYYPPLEPGTHPWEFQGDKNG